jgi:hypothetical protein
MHSMRTRNACTFNDYFSNVDILHIKEHHTRVPIMYIT